MTQSAATGVGSLPGLDPGEWCRVIRGELPELPHLPELPARGPGSDMIGRTLGMLNAVSPDFAADTTPTGWRLSGRQIGASRAMRRAQSWLAEDLDAAEQVWHGHPGRLKLQLAGPVTMMAAVEAGGGERLLADAGACRDLAAALAHVAADQVREAARRFPHASLIVQLDEPSLPAVLAGGIRVQSGFGRYQPLPGNVALAAIGEALAAVVASGAAPAVHCCAADVPVDLLLAARAQLVSLDLTLAQRDEEIGRLLESGMTLLAGLDLTAAGRDRVRTAAAPLRALLGRLGFPLDKMTGQLGVTPRCGLAGATARSARDQYELAAAVARALNDDDERAGAESADRNRSW